MDLKTFVSETLLQISEGIVEAQKATKTSGTSINPPLYNSSTSRENQINTSNKVNFIPQYIEFDVLVTVENSNTAGGKGNIHIAMFGLEAGKNTGSKDSSASRIKFSIPVAWPSSCEVEKDIELSAEVGRITDRFAGY